MCKVIPVGLSLDVTSPFVFLFLAYCLSRSKTSQVFGGFCILEIMLHNRKYTE